MPILRIRNGLRIKLLHPVHLLIQNWIRVSLEIILKQKHFRIIDLLRASIALRQTKSGDRERFGACPDRCSCLRPNPSPKSSSTESKPTALFSRGFSTASRSQRRGPTHSKNFRKRLLFPKEGGGFPRPKVEETLDYRTFSCSKTDNPL